MTLPAWADAELSAALPTLVLAGETQEVEFKREFPSQVSDLAKEIAGFATSNDGTIFIGVADDCSIVGLANADHSGRADVVRRVEGLCANSVKPPITPRIRFADIDGKCVVAIDVPKGAQPIYYVANIPYLRQVTAARPMSPDEVIETVVRWANQQGVGEPTAESIFLSKLANLLVETDICVAELRVRDLNPWLDDLKNRLGYLADDARELAASVPHEFAATEETLEKLAEECDTLATGDSSFSDTDVDFLTALDDAEALIKHLRSRYVGPGRFGKRDADAQAERVRVTARLFAAFMARVDANPDDWEEAQLHEAVRERGLELLRAASLGIGIGDEDKRLALWDIGMALRALELMETFMDGGASYDALINAMRAENKRLQDWIAQQATPT